MPGSPRSTWPAAAVGEAQAVVDTSKNPQHGFLLRNLPGVRLVVVHLVRDSRAVAFSWRGRPGDDERAALLRRAPLRSVLAWLVANVLAELLAVSTTSVRLRYEELCADPDASADRILELAGVTRRLAVGADARPWCTPPLGNPIRHDTGPLVLRRDDEWATSGWRGRGLVTACSPPRCCCATGTACACP